MRYNKIYYNLLIVDINSLITKTLDLLFLSQ